MTGTDTTSSQVPDICIKTFQQKKIEDFSLLYFYSIVNLDDKIYRYLSKMYIAMFDGIGSWCPINVMILFRLD